MMEEWFYSKSNEQCDITEMLILGKMDREIG